MQKTFIVIGAGASGFFAAITAARLAPGLKVIILEKSSKILSKVRISGGGRCNVTHSCFDIAEMSRKYPRGTNFVKKTFHRFFTNDTIAWFKERGVELKTEEDGRMFPVSDSSQTIIDCLIREANKFGIDLMMNADVKAIRSNQEKFSVSLADGRELNADFVCVACGGFPKTSMFEWLLQTGHTIQEPVPSLFTFNLPSHPITKLMGVAVENAQVKILSSKLVSEGPLLITHWGLSGPAILRLSAYAARILAEKEWKFRIIINWLLHITENDLRSSLREKRVNEPKIKVHSRNSFALPQRLWEFFCEQSEISKEVNWADLKSKNENALVRLLSAYEFEVSGKTTFKEEFVTAGGINLSEVDPQTMMSRKVKNLFFAGEILDVDGITGGFNFQHAWTSGFIAGSTVASIN